jgi:uncharacterized protein
MPHQKHKQEAKKRRTPPGEELAPEAVAAWLRRNPDFLANNPDLLLTLTPPDQSQGQTIVDFQRFMVERQRRELDKLKASSQELLAASRGDKALQRSVHRAVLALLSAPTFERTIATVIDEWSVLLGVDVVMIGVETAPDQPMPRSKAGLTALAAGEVESRLGRMQDVRIIGSVEPPDPSLFGEAAGLARSIVMLRLPIHDSTPPGLLAIGARDPGRFRPSQNTELLRFLAMTLAVTIRAWLNLPEPTTIPAR